MESPPKNSLPPALKPIISCAILFYLFVLILGPLSNPVGSEHLTRPIAKKVSPIHRALFLGHGYRFFAPDPGPSHLIEFEITKEDGSVFKGHFPDRDDAENSFPRLQYHRWFMLSETIWSEHSMTLIEADFRAQQKRLENLATEKQIAGHHKIASRIRRDIAGQKKDYEMARKRIDDLVKAVAKNLLDMHGGIKIKLFVREREIPFPFEVQEGSKLDDERFLKPEQPPLIGEFTAEELGLNQKPNSPLTRKPNSPLPANSDAYRLPFHPTHPVFVGRGVGGEGEGIRFSSHQFASATVSQSEQNYRMLPAPHPPTPSPHEFGQRLIPVENFLVRIHEERESVGLLADLAVTGDSQ